jgi:hypothetical protein
MTTHLVAGERVATSGTPPTHNPVFRLYLPAIKSDFHFMAWTIITGNIEHCIAAVIQRHRQTLFTLAY